ncbi:MAG: TPM domain-containing protein [Dokdonella sp.]
MNLVRHWLARFQVHKAFPQQTLDKIQAAIASGEQHHLGEVCFAIEGGLPWFEAFTYTSARDRAEAAFARLRVWNTEGNTGVLIYILLAEQAIEIVADRGIAAKVAPEQWRAICAELEQPCRDGNHAEGTMAAIASIHRMLTEHFPASGRSNPDELPNRPQII